MPASNEPWTIDSIAHALPHPVTRQRFLTEINLTPVDRLPETVARWMRVAEDWTAAWPRIEARRERHQAGLAADDAETLDITDDVRRHGPARGQAQARGSRGAA